MLYVAHKSFKNTANMSDTSTWKKRMPARIYDYNYKVSEGYYHPQTSYLENRDLDRSYAKEPPKHQSYAERFASKPWYGGVSGLPYDETRSALSEPLLKLSERKRGSSLVREIQDRDQENVPLHIRASRRRKKFEEEERERGVRPKLTKQTSLINPPFSRLNDIRKEINQIHNDMVRKVDLTKDTENSAYKSSFVSSTSNSRLPIVSSRTTKSTYTESSSSKPRQTFTDSVFQPWPRRRASVSDDAPLPVSYNRADKFREIKRTDEKKDMAKDVTNLVDKIRAGGSRIDSDIAFNFASNLRSSSLEPISRRGSRKGRIVYGMAK